jgi:hypothetical protein
VKPKTAAQRAIPLRPRGKAYAYPVLREALSVRPSLVEPDPGTPTYDGLLAEFIKKRAPKGASR